MTPDRLFQHMLDEQGYIVIGWSQEVPIGYIFSCIAHNPATEEDGFVLHGPAVVIARATRQEIQEQALRFGYRIPGEISNWSYFYRVTAE